uniref:Putative plant transposon protein domain-containing protein n=1 Tax=Nicotiana tabacum TaxID=4097 RepID=A0A1S4B6D6_TOBAC|nr:PREDICTED: uncharacterized protein LOC107804976 [Nicotiana tabacum]
MHVMNVGDEVDEEPGSLTRKRSQKHGLPKPKRGSSVTTKSLNKSDEVVSSENIVKESGDTLVEESSARVMEELGEKSVKSAEKGKNVCKSAKRKADADEEPSSSKKAKVHNPQSAGKEKLRNQKWTHLFTSDAPRVYEEEAQSFYADFFKVEDNHICVLVNGVDMVIDSVLLGSILGVPAEGLSNVQGTCSQNFRNAILKDRAVQQGERVQKKALLPVYQLLFDMLNKVLLPRAERRSITSCADLFLMEALDNFTTINLPGIMIEHMQKMAEFKDSNHGLPYGFLLTKVFEYFKVPLGQAKVGTKKKTFSKSTLEECECINRFGGVGSTSTISQLINAQNSATAEIRQLKAMNAILESQLSQLQKAPGSSISQSEEVACLTKENVELKKQVEELKEKLLNEQMSANARMDLVFQTLASASKPSPSSAP